MNRTYSQEELSLVLYVEKQLRVGVKDVIQGKKVTIVVEPGSLRKALGKGASNIKRLEQRLKKPVRMIEFSDNISEVAAQLVYPAEIEAIEFTDGVLTIQGKDMKSRGMMIGRDRSNIERVKSILSRYFNVESVVVK